MILEQQALWNYQKQTYGVLGSPAKIYPLPVNKKGSRKVSEADCFMKLCGCLPVLGKKIDLNGCSLKMLKIYLALETDLISRGCSLKWGGMGTLSNGSLSTQKTLAFPKTGKGCSLLDILETEVDEKYFLSDQQTERILANCKN